MKKYILFNIILFIFISCQKNKLNRSTTSSQDNTIAVIAFNDLLKVTEDVIINEELEKSSNSILNNCAAITIHPSLPDTSFPKTITIDFGPVNCTDVFGVDRRGKLIVIMDGRYRDAGTTISITTNEFYLNNHKVEGTKTLTNEGLNNEGHSYFISNIVNGNITYPSGDQAKYESNRIIEWVIGEDTQGPLGFLDDEYDITGTSSGINRNGRDYTSTITSPLRFSMSCKWIKKGSIELQPANLYTRNIDFGEGECDSEITVDINGNIYNIDSP